MAPVAGSSLPIWPSPLASLPVNGVSMNGCTVPAVVILTRRLLLVVMYRMLLGPCTMSLRKHWQPSTRNSSMLPAGVILPIWVWNVPPELGSGLGVKNSLPSVNQRFLSEPTVTYLGSLFVVGTLYCVNLKRSAALAAESIAPSTMASPATRATTTANRRRFDDLWCVNIPSPPSEATSGRVRAASWLSFVTLYGNWQDQWTFAPFYTR